MRRRRSQVLLPDAHLRMLEPAGFAAINKPARPKLDFFECHSVSYKVVNLRLYPSGRRPALEAAIAGAIVMAERKIMQKIDRHSMTSNTNYTWKSRP
jgi:hypothetical protein